MKKTGAKFMVVLIGDCNFHGSAPLSVITHDYRGLAGKRQQSWIFCKIRIELCSGMRYNDKKGCGPLRPVFQPVRCIYDDIYSAL